MSTYSRHMPRSSEHAQAEAVARQRQLQANEPRRDRDVLELSLGTKFERARRHRDDAAEKVVAAELEMGNTIVELLAIGNSPERVAKLTGVDDQEFKRLRKVAESAESPQTPMPGHSSSAPQPSAGPTERTIDNPIHTPAPVAMRPTPRRQMQPETT